MQISALTQNHSLQPGQEKMSIKPTGLDVWIDSNDLTNFKLLF